MQILIDNLEKNFSEQVVLDGVTLHLESGIYVLTGPSGCGKTTLARILCGLETADSGTVLPTDYKVSFMFQEPRLFNWLNVVDNVVKVTECSVERATELLSALELRDDLNKHPHELSVGMQRRVAIARTLAREAELYIFDEPLAGLDDERKITVCKLIKENVGADAIVLIISHDLFGVSSITDKIVHLEYGKII